MRTTKKTSLVHGYKVEKTAKKMKHIFSKLLINAKIDITVDQWILLEQLATNDGINQLELSRLVSKDPPTVTRIIDLLAKKTLVDRVLDEKDRRKFKVKITRTGRQVFEEVNKIAIQFRIDMYQGLSVKDVDQLAFILNTINKNLDDTIF